jgi:hypothetical protein
MGARVAQCLATGWTTRVRFPSEAECLQPYPVVAADALLEIGAAVISAVLALDEHLSQTNTSCVSEICYQSICCRIRYFLVRIRIAECFTNSRIRFR